MEGCGREVWARSLCDTHYRRQRRGIDLTAPMRVVDPDRGCSVTGCDHVHHAHGLCDKHNKARLRGKL